MRYRTIEHVLNEIDILVNRYHVQFFIFADANFPITKKYGLEFCEQFKKTRHWGK